LRQRPFAAYGEKMKLVPVLTVFVGLSLPAFAQEPLRIGLSVPLSGPYKLLGEQARAGAEAAVTALATSRTIELTVVDDKCTAEGGKAAVTQFSNAKVEAVAGFLCTATLIETRNALPRLPMITASVRTDAVTKTGPTQTGSVFRLGPTTQQETEAISKLLIPLWRGKKFAIVDDGTLRARELSETLRLAAEAEGLKPAFADAFKPGLEDQSALLGRLTKSGVTHLFMGADREDIAILAQNAAAKNYKLTIAASETLNAAPLDHALPDGVLMVGVPPVSAGQVAPEAETVPEGYFQPAYAAIEILAGSASGVPEGKTLSQAILDTSHETVMGDIKFAPNGDLLDNPYALLVSKAGNFEIYQQ
jgi:branched-chain amino acid transport system substrate-binding protein